jgi:hypothetical protein
VCDAIGSGGMEEECSGSGTSRSMTADPDRLADFWQAALELGERKVFSAEILLADADWGFPRFTFQRISDGRSQASAVHVDLTAEDRLVEVARLVAPGATEGATHEDDEVRWTVMRDPDGNEFCVTD